MAKRHSSLGMIVFALAIATACGGGSDRISELESQLSELQSRLSTTTSTGAVTTSSVSPSTTHQPTLSAAQQVYCDDLTSVVAVRTPTGGSRARPETVQFFEIAHRLGYLTLPYTQTSWGKAVAETPEDFVSITHTFWGVLSLDIDEGLRLQWRLNLAGTGLSFGDVYAAVCHEAWELR